MLKACLLTNAESDDAILRPLAFAEDPAQDFEPATEMAIAFRPAPYHAPIQ